MSDFTKGQTNKTLEKMYGEEYVRLSPEEREKFYENLAEDVQVKVKITTTFDLGAGYNRLVLNDETRSANFLPKTTFGELRRNAMQAWLANEKRLGPEQGEDTEVEDKQESELNGLYRQYKETLADKFLPPTGLSIVCFRDPARLAETFTVLTCYDIEGMLSTFFECRLLTLFKQRFPTKIDIKRVEEGETCGAFT